MDEWNHLNNTDTVAVGVMNLNKFIRELLVSRTAEKTREFEDRPNE